MLNPLNDCQRDTLAFRVFSRRPWQIFLFLKGIYCGYIIMLKVHTKRELHVTMYSHESRERWLAGLPRAAWGSAPRYQGSGVGRRRVTDSRD